MNQTIQPKPYVPNFENDIFISYAHIDNAPLAKNQEGWVTFFHTALQARLRQWLGVSNDVLVIWRDAKLQGNDYLSDTLLKQFPQIAVLVSILSPRYIESEWCRKELQEFAEVAEKTGGLSIEDKARIFKVVKTLIPREEYPEALQGLLGYEFFTVDAHKDRPSEFRPELGPDAEQNFFVKLEDLAYDIHLLLKTLKARQSGASDSTRASGCSPAVYLAPTTSDLSEVYDEIRRELLVRNCRVLPTGDLPLHNTVALKNRVLADLGRCNLSVHLIGAKYGFVPEDETHSLVEIQHELASEFSRNDGLSRLIWLPPGLQTLDERQQKFIHALRTDAYIHEHADLLEMSRPELKRLILVKLRNSKSNGADMSAPGGRTRVYLICSEQDREAVAPVEDHLYEQDFEVELPDFEGEETERRQTHQDKLLNCDGVLIYCGEVTDAWLSIKKNDLQKAFGWGRKRPFKATTIYLADPKTDFKQHLRSHEIKVLKNFAAFSPTALAPFVHDLKGGRP